MATENDSNMATESNTRPRDESNSPGKDRKHPSTATETTETLDSLKDFLRGQHKEVMTKFDGLNTQVMQLRQTIDPERSTRIRDVSEIKARLDTIESKERDDLDTIIKTKVYQALKNASISTTTEYDRTKEVIASGFEDETHANNIIQYIEALLNKLNRRDKVTHVYTYEDPSNIGVITFESVAAQIGFLKRVGTDDASETYNGRNIRFSNNEPFHIRKRNKQLGQVKYQLNNVKGIPLNDINIDRKKGIVEVNRDEVALFTEADEMIYKGKAT